jgi:hypothetical protein
MILHNFIRRTQLYEDEFDAFNEEEVLRHRRQGAVLGGPQAPNLNGLGEDDRDLAAWRDGIAQRMWDAYQIELARRGRV